MTAPTTMRDPAGRRAEGSATRSAGERPTEGRAAEGRAAARPDGAARRDGAGRPTQANRAWEALLTAHATLMRQFAAEDIWRDVSMREYDVLYTLAKCAEPARLCDLEEHVLLSQPAISRLVDRLVARGLVAKEPDPADRRAVRLALTEEGRALQRRTGSRHARSVARIVGARLTGTELEHLQQLATTLATGEGLSI